VLRNWHY